MVCISKARINCFAFIDRLVAVIRKIIIKANTNKFDFYRACFATELKILVHILSYFICLSTGHKCRNKRAGMQRHLKKNLFIQVYPLVCNLYNMLLSHLYENVGSWSFKYHRFYIGKFLSIFLWLVCFRIEWLQIDQCYVLNTYYNESIHRSKYWLPLHWFDFLKLNK